MKNLDKMMFGAAGLAAAAGAVGAETPKIDSTEALGAKAAQVSEFRGKKTEVLKDANGQEYVIIEGKKFVMAPKDSLTEADLERIKEAGKKSGTEFTEDR